MDQEAEFGVAHHGPPIMTQRDVDLCATMAYWIKVVRKAGNRDFVPSEADIIKSRLFWRLRAGKPPLEHPPPRAYSCPWYEVVEEDRPHWAYDGWVAPTATDESNWFQRLMAGKIVLAQCAYEHLGRNEDGSHRCKFGPWEFRAWQGPSEHGGHEGWWVQRVTPN